MEENEIIDLTMDPEFVDSAEGYDANWKSSKPPSPLQKPKPPSPISQKRRVYSHRPQVNYWKQGQNQNQEEPPQHPAQQPPKLVILTPTARNGAEDS